MVEQCHLLPACDEVPEQEQLVTLPPPASAEEGLPARNAHSLQPLEGGRQLPSGSAEGRKTDQNEESEAVEARETRGQHPPPSAPQSPCTGSCLSWARCSWLEELTLFAGYLVPSHDVGGVVEYDHLPGHLLHLAALQ